MNSYTPCMRLSPHELAAIKAANPVEALISARVRLGPPNARGIRSGPCLCEPVRGKVPLWLNTALQTWGCLRGGGCGGDLFDYLEQFEGLDFASAIRRLGGQPTCAKARMVDPRVERERKRNESDAALSGRTKAEKHGAALTLPPEHLSTSIFATAASSL